MTDTNSSETPNTWSVPLAYWQSFAERLCRERTVYAPQRSGDSVRYLPLAPGGQVCLDELPSSVSARGVLLPQRETLFRFRASTTTASLEAPAPSGPAVILGVPPCDARAFQVLDQVFDTPERPDPYYVTRRRQTAVVGVACARPRSTCFCTQVGGDPCAREGCDLYLTDLGREYVVEALTPTGRELVAGWGWRPATPAQRAQAARLAAQARAALPAASEPLALGSLSRESLESPVWGSLGRRCLGCGICSYVCPTCHCFDIVDEMACAGCGERIRNWDSCQFAVYSLEASGHNPRPSRRERFRQRVLDKFVYLPVRASMLGCVGCGRCVRACPVNIDLREVIEEVRHA